MKRRTTLIPCFLFALTATFPCWAGSIDQLEGDFLERFEALLNEQRNTADIPGGTAAFVLPDGRVVGVATGFADRELGLEMRPDTRMFAGSTGKTYAAALMMSMVAAGQIALDDKLEKYLGDEEWYPRLANSTEITIRHLLNHSSGLNRYVYTDDYRKLIIDRLSFDPYYSPPPRMLVGFILDDEPLFPAGEGYSYADTNFLLAGIVMEKIGGFILEHEIVRRLLYPHGLVLTGPQEGIWHPGLAQGYVDSELLSDMDYPKTAMDRGLYRFNPMSEWTGGGFISNSMELARWAKILYEGNAMGEAYLEDMIGLVNVHSRDQGYEYGIGVVLERSPEFGLILRHAGVYYGYGTSMAYYADYGIAIATQVNAMNADAAKAIRAGLARLLINACRNDRAICPERISRD